VYYGGIPLSGLCSITVLLLGLLLGMEVLISTEYFIDSGGVLMNFVFGILLAALIFYRSWRKLAGHFFDIKIPVLVRDTLVLTGLLALGIFIVHCVTIPLILERKEYIWQAFVDNPVRLSFPLSMEAFFLKTAELLWVNIWLLGILYRLFRTKLGVVQSLLFVLISELSVSLDDFHIAAFLINAVMLALSCVYFERRNNLFVPFLLNWLHYIIIDTAVYNLGLRTCLLF
jgi:hypothetical protein